MKPSPVLEPAQTRPIVADLKTLLANTYVLYVKTQNFHWNVEDPRFHSLHVFFEEHYKELADAVDLIAERIRVLREKTPASLAAFLELTTLNEAGDDLDTQEMLRELLHDHENISVWLRGRIEPTQKLGDEGTADLMIERLRAHEKAAWMLRSHLM